MPDTTSTNPDIAWAATLKDDTLAVGLRRLAHSPGARGGFTATQREALLLEAATRLSAAYRISRVGRPA